jgi:hypothetical protein
LTASARGDSVGMTRRKVRWRRRTKGSKGDLDHSGLAPSTQAHVTPSYPRQENGPEVVSKIGAPSHWLILRAFRSTTSVNPTHRCFELPPIPQIFALSRTSLLRSVWVHILQHVFNRNAEVHSWPFCMFCSTSDDQSIGGVGANHAIQFSRALKNQTRTFSSTRPAGM